MNKEPKIYLHTRITPTNKAYVLRACAEVGKTLSDFTRDAVMAEADYILGNGHQTNGHPPKAGTREAATN